MPSLMANPQEVVNKDGREHLMFLNKRREEGKLAKKTDSGT